MKRASSFCAMTGWLLSSLMLANTAQAQLEQILPPIGGPGGGEFTSGCNHNDILTGVTLSVGDDVDGVQIVCREPYDYNGGYPQEVNDYHGGAGGSRKVQLLCPKEAPLVTGIDVAYEGEATVIVNSVHLFCGASAPGQSLTPYPVRVFDGPRIGGRIPLRMGRAACPDPLVAVGIRGRSGKWLDALTLECGALHPRSPWDHPAPPPNAVKSLGRVNTGAPTPRNPLVHSICDGARDALSRQSPAAPNLVAQCRAQGGYAAASPSNLDLEKARAKGETLAAGDDALDLLRSRTPHPDRRGFEVGLGIWEGSTAPGPGKQRYHDALISAEQRGFDLAAAYSLSRNKYAALVKVGLAIAAADPDVQRARTADNDPFYWLGFDIASGLFGDPAMGSEGSKVLGAGAITIRDSLNYAGKRGFIASMQLHLARSYQ